MLKEIVRFTEYIIDKMPTYFTDDILPGVGIHLILKPDEKGDYPTEKSQLTSEEIIVIPKNNKETHKVAHYEYYSSWIDANKTIDPKKKIHSSVPNAIWFKKENLETENNDDNVQNRLSDYYVNVKSITTPEEEEKSYIEKIEHYCVSGLMKNLVKSLTEYQELKEGNYVKIYFLHEAGENKTLELMQRYQKNYFQQKLFLKNDYNVQKDDGKVGLSAFMNGLNAKKLFMKHTTTSFEVNTLISEHQASVLYQFEKLLKSKPRKLPNPLPVFIDKERLNYEQIRIISEEKVLTTNEILHEILNKEEDTGCYLLINWANTKDGLMFRDVDYAAGLKLRFDNKMTVRPIVQYSVGTEVKTKSCSTVFEFELWIIQTIFRNALITQRGQGGYIYKYFDEISKEYCSSTTYHNVMKYRKAFYDYIYKSRRESITARMWFDILMSEIIDAVKGDKEFKNQYLIRELLDILFSLNQYFDSHNSNFGGHNMPTLLPALQDKIREILQKKENVHLETDEEFCFAAGQLIYRIIDENSSEKKTHALLETYISKTEPEQFKIAVANGFKKYSHAFEIWGKGKGRDETLFGEFFAYKTDANLKDMLPIVLAGYFSRSLIFEKSEENIAEASEKNTIEKLEN